MANLKNRMNSVKNDSSESKQNSTNTTEKSNQQSLELLEKQSEIIKKLKQSSQEKDLTIQTLSSENSTLRNELQLKSEKVLSLEGRIEKMSESDLLLSKLEQKENELRLKDRELQKKELKLSEKESSLKNEQDMITEYRYKLKTKETDLKNAEKDYAKRVKEEADKSTKKHKEWLTDMWRSEVSAMKDKYTLLRFHYEELVYWMLSVVMLVNIFQIIKTVTLKDDTIALGKGIATTVITWFNDLVLVSGKAALLGNLISHPILSKIIYWVIAVIIFLVLFSATILGIAYILNKGIRLFLRHFKDNWSIGFAIFPMLFLVYFIDDIKKIWTLNFWGMFVIVYVLYIAGRCFLTKLNKDIRNTIITWFFFISCIVGLFALLVKFLGVLFAFLIIYIAGIVVLMLSPGNNR